MGNYISVSQSSGNTTGVGTANPQNVGQDSALSAESQSLQTSNSSSSINNQSSATLIPLQPTELRTAAIQPTAIQGTQQVSSGDVAVATVLIAFATLLFAYTYLTNKKSVKNT